MFKKYQWPTVEELIYFLELEMGKDIVVIDLESLGRTDIPKYGIILSAYSTKHCYRIAKNLVKALEKLEIDPQI